MRRSNRWMLVAALASSGGLTIASGAGAAVRASGIPVGSTGAVAAAPSVVRCQLDLMVRVSRGRFETTGGQMVKCAGQLQGRPIVEGAFASLAGAAEVTRVGQSMLPAFGESKLQLSAAGVQSPDEPKSYTAIALSLRPRPLALAGGSGHYTGSGRVGGRLYKAAASSVFRPVVMSDRSECCVTGRLMVDLTVWNAAPAT